MVPFSSEQGNKFKIINKFRSYLKKTLKSIVNIELVNARLIVKSLAWTLSELRLFTCHSRMAVEMSEGQCVPQLRTLASTLSTVVSTSWLFHGCSNTFPLSLEQPIVTFVFSGIEIHPVSPS